jgi:glycosyltransferase involved in cell wall biosynthesis
MRLLYVTPEYPPHAGGGIATFYAVLLPELARMGHDVRVVVANAFSEAHPGYTADGVRVEFVGTDRMARTLAALSQFAEVPTLRRHLAAAWAAWDAVGDHDGFDVVETSDWGLLFVPWILSRPRPAIVVQGHGSIGQIAATEHEPGSEIDALLTQLIEQNLMAAADDVQTYSAMNAATWNATLSREVACILPAWKPRTANAAAANGSGIVVGRIQEWKGAVVLCEAMRTLGANAPVINWVGKDTRFLARRTSMSTFLAENFPDVWGRSVLPIGLRSMAETNELQSRAAFAVVPSTWDVFNFTVAEAMGAGRPVVCSERAGAVQLIEDGVNGIRVAADDPAALAEAIVRVQNLSNEERTEMGRRARETVETRLNPELIAGQRLSRYAEIARRGRGRAPVAAVLDSALRPGSAGANPFDFLNRFALADLTRYLRRRVLEKFLHR